MGNWLCQGEQTSAAVMRDGCLEHGLQKNGLRKKLNRGETISYEDLETSFQKGKIAIQDNTKLVRHLNATLAHTAST